MSPYTYAMITRTSTIDATTRSPRLAMSYSIVTFCVVSTVTGIVKYISSSMREAAFQRQNADRWKHFEALLKERHGVDPDRLADLYVHITDDLAYARTFYPESRTTTYLNALAAEIHQKIY